jgi:hypothetical protein
MTEFEDPGSRGTTTASMMLPTYVPGVSVGVLLTFLPILRPLSPPEWYVSCG